ncbi:hypothetical protein ACIP5Y_43520 [Nocardia sp. NPDC088792]|uniref:hypothetical protein n=1 Tax=Nocardia sp. NPDC088792 TaxID=3364332 RepID=UPI0037F14D31
MHAFFYAVPVVIYTIVGAAVISITLRRTADSDPATRRAEIWRAFTVILIPVLVGPILIGGITGRHLLQFVFTEVILAALVVLTGIITVRRATKPLTAQSRTERDA